jgi:HTH-type transcriptional regulator / antitoxin HipB
MASIVRTPEDLARIVRERRRELGLSQEDLAGVIGVHRMFVSQLESGKRSMRLESVLRLVQALGLDIELRTRDK